MILKASRCCFDEHIVNGLLNGGEKLIAIETVIFFNDPHCSRDLTPRFLQRVRIDLKTHSPCPVGEQFDSEPCHWMLAMFKLLRANVILISHEHSKVHGERIAESWPRHLETYRVAKKLMCPLVPSLYNNASPLSFRLSMAVIPLGARLQKLCDHLLQSLDQFIHLGLMTGVGKVPELVKEERQVKQSVLG